MASMYSAKVMEHFANPHNVGEIPDANGVGEVGNPKCGDIMRMYLKIENNVIVDVKFLTFGCGAAIATSSMATDLIKGKTIDEALKTDQQGRCRGSGRSASHQGPLLCSGLSRPSRPLCPTTTVVRASTRNPSWASWKRTATIAAARATETTLFTSLPFIFLLLVFSFTIAVFHCIAIPHAVFAGSSFVQADFVYLSAKSLSGQ